MAEGNSPGLSELSTWYNLREVSSVILHSSFRLMFIMSFANSHESLNSKTSFMLTCFSSRAELTSTLSFYTAKE